MDKQNNKFGDKINNARAQYLRREISFRALLRYEEMGFSGDGRHERCSCPFRKHHVPTFTFNYVDTSGGCFECRWFGGVVEFTMLRHKLDFAGALDHLEQFLFTNPDARRSAELIAEEAISQDDNDADGGPDEEVTWFGIHEPALDE